MASNPSVLVAEDNGMLADVLRFNLQRAGFDVVTVPNGRLALEQLQHRQFDLVITDYQMPEVDGQTLCRAIRDQESLDKVPIIICSAKGLEMDLDAICSEYRVSKVVFKPFSTLELVALARKLLSDESPAASA